MLIGQTLTVEFITPLLTTGVATNADSTPTALIRRNGTSLGTSVTVTNLGTGKYKAVVLLDGADGWVAGDSYAVEATWTMAGTAGIVATLAQGVIETDLNAVLTAIKGGGWSTETLKAIYDQITLRLLTSVYTAPDNATITAINAKTTNLPSDPADASVINDSFSAIALILGTIDGRLDAEIPSIQSDLSTLISDLIITRGTAVGGSNSHIDLENTAPADSLVMSNAIIYLKAGTGANQIAKISAYQGNIRRAFVDPSFSVAAPDNTTEYVIFSIGSFALTGFETNQQVSSVFTNYGYTPERAAKLDNLDSIKIIETTLQDVITAGQNTITIETDLAPTSFFSGCMIFIQNQAELWQCRVIYSYDTTTGQLITTAGFTEDYDNGSIVQIVITDERLSSIDKNEIGNIAAQASSEITVDAATGTTFIQFISQLFKLFSNMPEGFNLLTIDSINGQTLILGEGASEVNDFYNNGYLITDALNDDNFGQIVKVSDYNGLTKEITFIGDLIIPDPEVTTTFCALIHSRMIPASNIPDPVTFEDPLTNNPNDYESGSLGNLIGTLANKVISITNQQVVNENIHVFPGYDHLAIDGRAFIFDIQGWPDLTGAVATFLNAALTKAVDILSFGNPVQTVQLELTAEESILFKNNTKILIDAILQNTDEVPLIYGVIYLHSL